MKMTFTHIKNTDVPTFVANNSSQPVTIFQTSNGWSGFIRMWAEKGQYMEGEEFPKSFETFAQAVAWVTTEVGVE